MFARDSPTEVETEKRCIVANCFFMVKLTEVTGNVIRNIDFPISRLPPLAARAGARVGILLCFIINDNVSFNQVGILFEEP